MDKMLNYKPKHLEDIDDQHCGRKYIYDRGNGRKSAFLHYVDGMEIWEYCPELWRGWKLALRIDATEKSIW